MSAVERENAWDAIFEALEDTGDAEYDAVFDQERRVTRKVAHLHDEIDALRSTLAQDQLSAHRRDQLARRLSALSRQATRVEQQAETLHEQLTRLAHVDE